MHLGIETSTGQFFGKAYYPIVFIHYNIVRHEIQEKFVLFRCFCHKRQASATLSAQNPEHFSILVKKIHGRIKMRPCILKSKVSKQLFKDIIWELIQLRRGFCKISVIALVLKEILAHIIHIEIKLAFPFDIFIIPECRVSLNFR